MEGWRRGWQEEERVDVRFVGLRGRQPAQAWEPGCWRVLGLVSRVGRGSQDQE